MRRTLGALAVLLALAGCGEDPEVTVSPPPEVSGVTLVSATAGGGDPATRSTDVTSDAALASYVQQFSSGFAADVNAAAQKVEVGDREVLLAQVVAVGCGTPEHAHVRDDVIVPEKVPSPMKECLAPVTTVGLAAVSP